MTDPMTDYIAEWVGIWAKARRQVGAGLTEEAVIQITRDIIGPFVYWLDRNLEHYGFKTKNEYMQKHLVETLEKHGSVQTTQTDFITADKVPGSFEDSSGLTVNVPDSNDSYKIVVDSKNTYDHRATLHELGLQWNRDEHQWEGNLSLDKIQAVRNFCADKGLDFQAG